jgi:uncharacterized repeat protein (TIGR04052 family)
MANSQPARCGAALGELGSDVSPVVLHDARFYVQDVALIDEAGTQFPLRLDVNDWQNDQVALLDFEDGSGNCVGGTADINHQVTGTVPAGRYSALSFTVGVPQALNHTSTELADPPLDIAGMSWSWQAGRKFAKIEVDPQGGITRADGSQANTWFIHLGSTDCSGNPMTGEDVVCGRSNRVPVTFDRFDPETQVVVLDLTALFQESRLSEDRGGAAGCMSDPTDPECGPVFERLGLSPSDGVPIVPGRSPAFSVASKP